MGCVQSSEIIKINENHEDKTDNNLKSNSSNIVNNSYIKDLDKIPNKKKQNEEMIITKKNSNKKNDININRIEDNQKEKENEKIEVKAEIIQTPSKENTHVKHYKIENLNVNNFNIPEITNKYDIIEETNRNQMEINYKMRSKNNKKKIKTLKVIKKSDLNKNTDEKKIISEIEILKKLKHENIIQVEECLVDENNYYVIAEFCQFGSLDNYLNKNKKLTENQTKYIISQLLKAIQYLNSKNFVHTDIKPENILIEKIMKKRDEELCDIKLLDFGSSSSLINNPTNDIPIKNLPYYISPEIIDRKYNAKCDIWSIGVIMYEMLFGKKPFTGNNYNEVINNIKTKQINFEMERNNYNNNYEELSEDSIYLLKNMLLREIENRFDVVRCLENSWFVSLKEFEDLDEDINTDSNKKNSYENDYNSPKNLKKENNDSFQSKDNNNNIFSDKNDENMEKEKTKIKLKTQINNKTNFENIKSERSNRTYSLRSEDWNKEKEKKVEFIKLTIKYIHHYYRKIFHFEKEEENLKKMFNKNKINDKINIKEIIICFNKYSGYENNIITSVSSNELIEEKIKKKFPKENSLDFANFKNFMMTEKENDIIFKLKKKYIELEKTNREEIKLLFNEINKKPSIQRYFDEMKVEMDKDKLKEIYLFSDYLNLIERIVKKLNTKEEIKKFKEEEKKLYEEKIKKEKERRKIIKEEKIKKENEKKLQEEKRKTLEEEKKKKIEEEYIRKKLEEEERKKIDEEKKRKKEEEEKNKSSKILNGLRNSFLNNSLNNENNDLNKNKNAFNPEEFLKLVEK